MEESTTLDVLYAPIVKLERAKGNKLQRIKKLREKLREKKSFAHLFFLFRWI